MKKLFVVIVVFLILIGNVGVKNNFTLLDYFDGEYYAYSNSPISNHYIFLGSCYMNIGEVNSNDIVGESMIIENFEPIAAIIGFFLSFALIGAQPWFLAFGAGAMIFVVIEDLIPDAMANNKPHLATWSAIIGFIIMMALDVCLG